MANDTIIVNGRDQNSDDVSYTYNKIINPSVASNTLNEAIKKFNGLTRNTILMVTRRHDEDITNA